MAQAEQKYKNAKKNQPTEATVSCMEPQCNSPADFIDDELKVAKPIYNILNCDENNPTNSKSNTSKIPEICFFANMLRPTSRSEIFYHCEKPISKPKEKMRFFCPKGAQNKCIWSPSYKDSKKLCSSLSAKSTDKCEKIIEPVKFCRNKKYVQMTANAFHEMADCFDLNQEDKKSIFALFSHESSFILNAKSKDADSARCYGALTAGAFQTANQYIAASKDVHGYVCGVSKETYISCCDPHKRIPKENPGNCSESPAKIRRCCRGLPLWKKNADDFLKFKNKCPHFRSAVFPEDIPNMNTKPIHKIHAISTKDDEFSYALTHNPYTCLFHSIYFVKTNINLFELLLPNLPYLFREENSSSGEKAVPLFPKQVLRKFFIQSAHNSGYSFEGVIEKFLNYFKTKIKSDSKPYTDYHNRLLNEQPLSETILFEEFATYFTENRNEIPQTNIQTKHFARKVKDNIRYMDHTQDLNHGLKRNFKSYMNKHNDKPPSNEQVDEFLNAVKQQCTDPFFSD